MQYFLFFRYMDQKVLEDSTSGENPKSESYVHYLSKLLPLIIKPIYIFPFTLLHLPIFFLTLYKKAFLLLLSILNTIYEYSYN